MTETQALSALAALSQPVRLRAFRELVRAGPDGSTPSALASMLEIAPPALAFHLRELVQAGLVTQQRSGRHVHYRPALAEVNRLIVFLTENCCEGAPCELPSVSPCLTSTQGEQAMSQRVMNVLFICTHNSARSIMAESILNQMGAGRFRGYSAGSQPAGDVNPMALQLLERNRYSLQGLRSKDWAEFAQTGAPAMDFVLTVCDKAAGEVCPVWPGQPMSAHWGVEDPAAATGTPEQIERAFQDAFLVLHRRISLFTMLPLDKLDRLSLQTELSKIGKS